MDASDDGAAEKMIDTTSHLGDGGRRCTDNERRKNDTTLHHGRRGAIISLDGGDGSISEESPMITVYLKQGFVVDGVLGILRSPGEEVFLRDVGHHKTQG